MLQRGTSTPKEIEFRPKVLNVECVSGSPGSETIIAGGTKFTPYHLNSQFFQNGQPTYNIPFTKLIAPQIFRYERPQLPEAPLGILVQISLAEYAAEIDRW